MSVRQYSPAFDPGPTVGVGLALSDADALALVDADADGLCFGSAVMPAFALSASACDP
jgi:hypothetical protein